MSTKKIREALTTAPDVELLEAAMKELEAIEEAGQAMASDMDMSAIRHAPSNIREAIDLMIKIGKETP